MSDKKEKHECPYNLGLTEEESSALSWLSTLVGQWSTECSPQAKQFHTAHVAMAKVFKKAKQNHKLLHKKDRELQEAETLTMGLVGLSPNEGGEEVLN